MIESLKKRYREGGLKLVLNKALWLYLKIDLPYSLKWKDYTLRGNNKVGFATVFDEICNDEIYAIDGNFKTIVDVGANTGIATVYFKHNFPNAKIISVEPTEENTKFFKQNIAGLQDIHLIEQPIWSEKRKLGVQDNWSTAGQSYNNSVEGKFESVTMPELMEAYSIKNIDLLKIDIEGGEGALLTENNSWLKNVQNIYVEIHTFSDYGMEKYSTGKILLELKSFGFKLVQRKNNVWLFSKIKGEAK